MRRTRVAVIGVGLMGTMHARAYAECDSADLVAVMDLHEERVHKASVAYGAKGTTSLEELLEDDSIEAFSVVLPDREHVETTCRVLQTGKAVLLEKPMADTLAGARQIAIAAEESGAPLMVAHLLRLDPRYVQAAAAVADGRIGDPVHVFGARFSPRSVGERLKGKSSPCFYLGVHDIDAIQWITGRPITRVYSRSVSKIMPGIGITSDDAIVSTFDLEGGAVGSLQFGWTIPDSMPARLNARLDVIGTEGVVQLDVHDHGLHLIDTDGVSFPDGLHYPEVHGRIAGDLAAEILHFVTSVREGNPFVISSREAMQAVAVNDAILRSVNSGQPENVESFE